MCDAKRVAQSLAHHLRVGSGVGPGVGSGVGSGIGLMVKCLGRCERYTKSRVGARWCRFIKQLGDRFGDRLVVGSVVDAVVGSVVGLWVWLRVEGRGWFECHMCIPTCQLTQAAAWPGRPRPGVAARGCALVQLLAVAHRMREIKRLFHTPEGPAVLQQLRQRSKGS